MNSDVPKDEISLYDGILYNYEDETSANTFDSKVIDNHACEIAVKDGKKY